MASKVIFYEYDFKKDRDIVIGSMTWDGKRMTAVGQGVQTILTDLTETGVNGAFPKDGEKFLKALKGKYDNPYLRASDVMTV